MKAKTVLTKPIRKFVLQLKSLIGRQQFEDELDEEIRFHLDMKAQSNIEAGMDVREAARQARRDFGNITLVQEDSRSPWLRSRVDELTGDLRYATRWLFRHPTFACAVVLTLAVGIGANSAVFSLLDALLFQIPAVDEPENIAFVGEGGMVGNFQGEHTRHTTLLSIPMAEALAQRQSRFDDLASMASYTSSLYLRRDGELEKLDVRLVSGNFFRVLGVGAAMGRVLDASDDTQTGSQATIVLSHDAWMQHFSGRANVLGETITTNGTALVVVGVTPPGFRGLIHGGATDGWIHLSLHPEILQTTSWTERQDIGWLRVFGRLSPGVELKEAGDHLTFLFRQRALEEWNDSPPAGLDMEELTLTLSSLADGPSEVRGTYSRPIVLLMGVVLIVLLIACANVANLLLARASSRSHELATRVALGAGRLRLLRQLLTEGVLLAGLGGGLGLVFAGIGVRSLLNFFANGEAKVFLDAGLDLRVITFTATVSLATVLLFGLVPALRGSGLGTAVTIRQGGTRSSRPSLKNLGSWLVIVQVALCLVLLVAAGLFLRTLQNLNAVDSGMAQESIVFAEIDTARSGFSDDRLQQLYRDLIETAEALPEVQAASISSYPLFSGATWRTRVFPEGVELEEDERVLQADMIGGHHFEALGVPLLEGRRFDQRDRADTTPVAIVNQAYAQRFYPGRGVVGTHLGFGNQENSTEIEVVGVVADAKYHSLREETTAMIYFPIAQDNQHLECLTINTTGDPGQLASLLRHELARLAPSLPIINIRTMPELISRSMTRERLIGRLSLLFAGLALPLAALGIYGVLSYSVAGRVRELGVRIALGAKRREIEVIVLRDALVLILIGVLLGLPAAYALGRFASSMLYGLLPGDPLTMVVAAALMIVAGLVSSYIPARRAAKLDPIEALRVE